jgi:hypothetical protein
MLRKSNKRKTISVSDLSRYYDDKDGFESFLKTAPNRYAIKAGEKYHNFGLFQQIPKLLILIVIGVIGFVIVTSNQFNINF